MKIEQGRIKDLQEMKCEVGDTHCICKKGKCFPHITYFFTPSSSIIHVLDLKMNLFKERETYTSMGWELISHINSCKKVLASFKVANHSTPRHRKSRCYPKWQDIPRKHHDKRIKSQAKEEA